MKKINWKKLVEDKTLLSIILAGTIVLTTVTVGIVMQGDNMPQETSPHLGTEESNQNLADGNEDRTEENSYAYKDVEPSATEELEQADANKDNVGVSMEDSTENLPEESESQTTAVVLQFGEAGTLTWPIAGSILREYSMDHTIYHATLEQYKVSPGILIQGEPGETVVSPAVGQITEVGYNEEIGNYVVLNLGSGYEAIIGQLDNIAVTQSQYVTAGTPLGVVAQPTKYASVEGPNVYFRLNKDGVAIDPMDYME